MILNCLSALPQYAHLQTERKASLPVRVVVRINDAQPHKATNTFSYNASLTGPQHKWWLVMRMCWNKTCDCGRGLGEKN